MRLFIAIFAVFILLSCDNTTTTSDTIYCKIRPKSNQIAFDSILFSSTNIVSFSESTGELQLKQSLSERQLAQFGKFHFYIGADSLFTARYATDYMSSIVDDLVLYYSIYDRKLFLHDGYPMSINVGIGDLRIENRAKRAAKWKRFIDVLKAQHKIIK